MHEQTSPNQFRVFSFGDFEIRTHSLRADPRTAVHVRDFEFLALPGLKRNTGEGKELCWAAAAGSAAPSSSPVATVFLGCGTLADLPQDEVLIPSKSSNEISYVVQKF